MIILSLFIYRAVMMDYIKLGYHSHHQFRQPKHLVKPADYKITVLINGRMGNHLFKLASLQGIAATNGMQVVFPRKLLYLYKFLTLKPELMKQVEGKTAIKYTKFKHIASAAYDEKTENR